MLFAYGAERYRERGRERERKLSSLYREKRERFFISPAAKRADSLNLDRRHGADVRDWVAFAAMGRRDGLGARTEKFRNPTAKSDVALVRNLEILAE